MLSVTAGDLVFASEQAERLPTATRVMTAAMNLTIRMILLCFSKMQGLEQPGSRAPVQRAPWMTMKPVDNTRYRELQVEKSMIWCTPTQDSREDSVDSFASF